MKEIIIVGAGISGMTAAIDLARKGVEVTVLEREDSIGGSPRFHPSVHSTPMDFIKVRETVGLDVSPVFEEIENLWGIIDGAGYVYRGGGLFNVERGPRPGSLDSFLYSRALAEGVRFRFGAEIENIEDVPPGSIIASGLHLDLLKHEPPPPTVRLFGYSSTIRTGRYNGDAVLCMDRFSNDYFYMAGMNGLLYGLLFARGKPFEPHQLAMCEEYVAERLGVEFPGWREIDGGFTCRPRATFKDRILAGSFAGVIDPCLGFGIYGAHLGGKVAALVALDPERGKKEFRRLTRWFNPALLYWSVFNFIPARHAIVNLMIRRRRFVRPLTPLVSSILPGNTNDWIGRALDGVEILGRGGVVSAPLSKDRDEAEEFDAPARRIREEEPAAAAM